VVDATSGREDDLAIVNDLRVDVERPFVADTGIPTCGLRKCPSSPEQAVRHSGESVGMTQAYLFG